MTLTLSIVAAFCFWRWRRARRVSRRYRQEFLNEREMHLQALYDIGKMQVELDENAKVLAWASTTIESARERMVLRRGVAEASNN